MTSGISVVIPMRDGARYIGEALDSIARQTLPVERTIVVDDGSTDEGTQVAAAHPLRPLVISIPPSGIGAARNRGVELVESPFVSFLDCDDLWTSDHCSLLMRPLRADSSLAMCFGYAEQFLSPDVPPGEAATIHVPDQAMPALVPGAMLARRTVFARLGPFREDLRVAEFMSWLLRAEHAGERYVVVPDVVLRRRHHGGNIGRLRGDDRRLDYVRAIREHLNRRRSMPDGEPRK